MPTPPKDQSPTEEGLNYEYIAYAGERHIKGTKTEQYFYRVNPDTLEIIGGSFRFKKRIARVVPGTIYKVPHDAEGYGIGDGQGRYARRWFGQMPESIRNEWYTAHNACRVIVDAERKRAKLEKDTFMVDTLAPLRKIIKGKTKPERRAIKLLVLDALDDLFDL